MNTEHLLLSSLKDDFTERNVQLLIDTDSGDIVEADEILDNTDEKIQHNIRHTIKLSQRIGKYKYRCAVCEQPVQLVSRYITSYGKHIFYFSYLKNSDDCPIKSTVQNPIDLIKCKHNAFKESDVHNEMVRLIGNCLLMDKSISDIRMYPNTYICDSSFPNENRRPDIVSTFAQKKGVSFSFVMEFHIFTTLLSTILGNDVFYKKNKIHFMWIFPSFSTFYQRVCQKDIYYLNHRNVFVFDRREGYGNNLSYGFNECIQPPVHDYEYAYEASIARQTLMLNCWYQTPILDSDGNVSIAWHHKLVSLHELIFDNNTFDVYYYDSDRDFYENADSLTQSKIIEWEHAVKSRITQIYNHFEEKSTKYSVQQERPDNAEKIKHFRQLINQAKHGFLLPEAFLDESSNLYGFRLNDFTLIKPRFSEIGDWSNGYISVRMVHWGVINRIGNKVLPFIYTSIGQFTNGVAIAVRKDGMYELINTNGTEISINLYSHISDFVEDRAIAMQNSKYGCIDRCNNIIIPFVYDFIDDFHNNVVKVRKNRYYGLLNEKGEVLVPCKYDKIGDFVEDVAIIKKGTRYGYYNKSTHIIMSCVYNKISYFVEGIAIIKKAGYYGCIDKNGNIIIPCVYDKFGLFSEGIAIVHKEDFYGCVDKQNNIVVPFEFSEIKDFVNGVAYAKKSDGSKYIIDKKGNVKPI